MMALSRALCVVSRSPQNRSRPAVRIPTRLECPGRASRLRGIRIRQKSNPSSTRTSGVKRSDLPSGTGQARARMRTLPGLAAGGHIPALGHAASPRAWQWERRTVCGDGGACRCGRSRRGDDYELQIAPPRTRAQEHLLKIGALVGRAGVNQDEAAMAMS
jgi:hypothetical protein